jgi:hypothetical protein
MPKLGRLLRAPRSTPESTSAIHPSVVAPEMKAGPLYPIVINPS